MVEEIKSETQVDTVEKTAQLVETEKSFQETVKSGIDTLTEVVQSIAESQLDISNRVKALETPTDLPLSPKGTVAGDDVGAKVTVPDTYQSNSVQAGLDDDRSGDKKPASDKGGLKMQQKSEHTFTTETPRPNAAAEGYIEKSTTVDSSQILSDARSGGYEGLSNVAKGILTGKYYTPSPDEVGVY
jgi:hypothetical protein